LYQWLGDLRGKRLLDVAGGDGYWAGKAAALGGIPYCLDIAGGKLARGKNYRRAPHLVLGDALALPFRDASFDAVMSVCAIEHFDDGPRALDEIARVLRPGGTLAMSADTLSYASRWPDLDAGHRRRYHVVRTYDHGQLATMLSDRGFDVLDHEYMFRGPRSEKLYLQLSRNRLAWNAAAPLAPLIAKWDRSSSDAGGSIVLMRARKR
jgi:SAM-dependent methyltransferase